MANQSGQLYGLTILSPISNDQKGGISHVLALREHLSHMDLHDRSPFARVPGTHFARLVVMDDVVFVGNPSKVDHLKSAYMIFSSDFNGDLDTYLRSMAQSIPADLDEIWKHCVGYPGAADAGKFAEYMKKCQVETTFYFADVNDKTLGQTLKALQVKAELSAFVEKSQGLPAGDLQKAFKDFLAKTNSAPPPLPGATHVSPFHKVAG